MHTTLGNGRPGCPIGWWCANGVTGRHADLRGVMGISVYHVGAGPPAGQTGSRVKTRNGILFEGEFLKIISSLFLLMSSASWLYERVSGL